MNRKFKVLGLVVVAALAMTAVMTSGAQAEGGKTGELTATSYPATITATPLEGKVHEFTMDDGKVQVTCNAKFTGTISQKTKELTVTPSYDPCVAHVSGMEVPNVIVTMNGCDFLFTSGTTKSTEEVLGSAKLVCHKDKRVEISAGTCKVTITPSHETHTSPHSLTSKHPLKGEVIYTNKEKNAKTPQNYVQLDATIEGITYEVHKGFLCPLGENTVKKADGVYHGSSLVKGFKDPGAHSDATEVAIDVK